MNRFVQLEQQHQAIKVIIKTTKLLLNTLNTVESQRTVAKNINHLAGLLKIHLSHEDKFLYPNLLKSTDKTLQVKTNQYMEEMGDLSSVYTAFKLKYNTVSKIQDNLLYAQQDIKQTFDAVEKRILKEDSDLYLIAKKISQ